MIVKEKWNDNLELTTFDGLTIKPNDWFITKDKYYAKYEPILCQFKLLTLSEYREYFGESPDVYRCTNYKEFQNGEDKEMKYIDVKLDLYPVTFLYPNQKVIDYEKKYWEHDKDDSNAHWKQYERLGYWIDFGFSYNDVNTSINDVDRAMIQEFLKLERKIKTL